MKRDPHEELPPYPADEATATVLYQLLVELWAWVTNRRRELNAIADSEMISRPRVLDGPAFHKLSVDDQYRTLQFVRRLRECWDHLIRQYGDNWDAEYCVRQKIVLVQTAVDQLNIVCTPTGRDEAFRRDMDRLQLLFRTVTSGRHDRMESM